MRPELRTAGRFLRLELACPLRVGLELAGHLRLLLLDLPQFLGLDLPIDFELAQIAEQRPLVGGQLVSFTLERLKALGRRGATGLRCGSGRMAARLRGGPSGHRENSPPQRTQRKTCDC